MNKKFTREELLQAYAQIQEERKSELALAKKACEWLHQKLGNNRIGVTVSTPPPYASSVRRHDVPYLPKLWLAIIYTQYDTGAEWDKWVEEQSSKNPADMIGINRNEKRFTLTLGPNEGFPEGTTYECHTQYQNAHGGGW